MDNLERYAREREKEKNAIKIAVLRLHRMDLLDEELLSTALDKAFRLGHNAGHCRGESHKTKLQRGAV
ncbi:hypothetical protein [Oceanobacillus alkalisoli]|uniref:hypothetical protein n=1 Tax=Oceanobacillus alkalisoli TaxID=2925113 RepID=UPI001EE489C1|nr:hypothetical protein [Oceanobacillus alkalisoli]MCG5104413.1 hypothetical protein [Oceanobacillus alkalisoli]